MEFERRMAAAPELRIMTEGAPRIFGRAAQFDKLSEDLGGFRERIRPGAFAASLAAVAAGQTVQIGAVVDMANFDGVVFLAAFDALDAGAATGLKVQQGHEADLSDAADLADTALAIVDSADNQLLALDVFRPAKRYLRAVW